MVRSHSVRTRRIVALCSAILLTGAVAYLAFPHIAAMVHLELGGRALEGARAFRAAHPDEPVPALDRALRHFARAVEIVPADGYAHRRLGQAWLLAGNNQAASDALVRAAALRPYHPLIYVELGMAYDGLGKADKALEAYEQGGYGPAVEAAIVNYLKVADWQIGGGDVRVALEVLEHKVLVLDEDNLPALVRLLQIYEREQPEQAPPLRERLAKMRAEEVTLPEEPRLRAYVEQAVAALVEGGIWTREKADAVLAR